MLGAGSVVFLVKNSFEKDYHWTEVYFLKSSMCNPVYILRPFHRYCLILRSQQSGSSGTWTQDIPVMSRMLWPAELRILSREQAIGWLLFPLLWFIFLISTVALTTGEDHPSQQRPKSGASVQSTLNRCPLHRRGNVKVNAVFCFSRSDPELIFLTILSSFVVSQGYGVRYRALSATAPPGYGFSRSLPYLLF